MTDLPTRLLAAIAAVERAANIWIESDEPGLLYGDLDTPRFMLAVCAAHRRIVARYTEAIEWATKAAPAGGLRSATAEVRVGVLAEVLDDLAAAYGVKP